ncbi:NUDIX domain-containing protein [Streptomyces sp. NPDC047046]|uniref:NUDIX hydrolase n=1 Tax=Streptomyces sp. NPDC047046 TaxID=3155378 RepID=UPI0034095FCA
MVERVDEYDRVLGVVERGEAVRRRWLHRIGGSVCRDAGGGYLVHRRAEGLDRFPGLYDCVIGGAVAVGEGYQDAAARELAEELGVDAVPRPVVRYLCRSGLSPYWLGLHEVLVTGALVADPAEVAWCGWLTEAEMCEAVRGADFVPDGREAFGRYRAAGQAGRTTP